MSYINFHFSNYTPASPNHSSPSLSLCLPPLGTLLSLLAQSHNLSSHAVAFISIQFDNSPSVRGSRRTASSPGGLWVGRVICGGRGSSSRTSCLSGHSGAFTVDAMYQRLLQCLQPVACADVFLFFFLLLFFFFYVFSFCTRTFTFTFTFTLRWPLPAAPTGSCLCKKWNSFSPFFHFQPEQRLPKSPAAAAQNTLSSL